MSGINSMPDRRIGLLGFRFPETIYLDNGMNQIIEYLRCFNSKERFFLVGHILGNDTFAPSPSFRENIGKVLDLQLPENVFAAMDFHLDWIYASLYLAFNQEQHCILNNEGLIKGHQEDIDFLLACEINSISHIILLEAKGLGSFTNKQMDSKAERFSKIFGMDGKCWDAVTPHFVLVSPREPQRLETSAWPAWMMRDNKVPYIKLPIPSGLKKVTRCNEQEKADQNGKYWTISPRRSKGKSDKMP